MAVEKDQDQALKILLEHGADVSFSIVVTLLCWQFRTSH
jgi:hypothetical protein